MKKTLQIVVCCILFVLGGCKGSSDGAWETFSSIFMGKPEAESLVMQETKHTTAEGLACPNDEYTDIVHYALQGNRQGDIYSFVSADDSNRVCSVFEFHEDPYNCVEFEWCGDKSIGEKVCDTGEAVVLSDNAEKYRLYIQKLDDTEIVPEKIAGRTERKWRSLVNHSLKGTKDFYEVTEVTNGVEVFYSVENAEWRGYVTFQYDYKDQKAYEIIYIENNEGYNSERALEIIRSVERIEPYIEQVVFEQTVELGEDNAIYADDFFDGSLLNLSRVSVASKEDSKVGEGSLVFADGTDEYTVKLEIVDTLPPEIIYKEDVAAIQYFVPGAELNAKNLADEFFEASDRSGSVSITFADGRRSVIISEDEFGETSQTEVVLNVKDRYGNMCEVGVHPAAIKAERVPDWYYTFFDKKTDYDSLKVLGRILCDVSCEPEDYLDLWYKGGGIRTSISNEDMKNAMEGYKRLETMGIEVSVSTSVRPSGVVLFYANMNYAPEEILQRFVQDGGIYELDGVEAMSHSATDITPELAENAMEGYKKADAFGISIVYGNDADILDVLNAYVMVENYSENKDFIDFVTTYDDNMPVTDMVEFLTAMYGGGKALEGYLRLKNLGIDVVISEIASAGDITRWFESAYRFPEELVQIYVENKWDVIVPEGRLATYVIDNNHIFLNNTEEKALKGYYMSNDMGLDVTFEEQMTFLELARFYEYLPMLSKEFLQMCAEEEIKLCTTLSDINLFTNESLVDVVSSYRALEAAGLDMGFEKGVSFYVLVNFCRVMDDMPEEFTDLYVKNNWEIELSSSKRRNYRDALLYMDDTIYDKALSGYRKIQKQKIKVNYLDVWQPIELVMFYAAIDSLPEYVLNDFVEHGWRFVVSDANLAKKYNVDGDAVGVTAYDNKVIETVSADFMRFIDDIVIHEIGHYVDYMSSEGEYYYSSEKQSFEGFYNKIKKQENGGKDWAFDSGDMLKDITSLYYRPYAFESFQEFFAESYVFYIAYPEELMETYPEVYNYLDKCTKKLQ